MVRRSRGPVGSRLVVTVCVAGLALTGCVATTPAAPKTTAADCSAVERAEDCGGVNKLITQAKEDGSLIVAGDPDAASPLASSAKKFTRDYGIKVEWVDAGLTTAQRLTKARSAASSMQPDAFALEPGDAVDASAPLAPYWVSSMDDRVPSSLRDPDGRWTYDFGGVMQIGYNETAVGSGFSQTLFSTPITRGGVLLPGDPASSASAVHAVIMLDAMAGAPSGSADGLRLLGSQPLTPGYERTSALADGTATVLIGWSYQQVAVADKLASDKVRWKSLAPSGAEVTGWHGVAINQRAQHPAAARLWEEYLLGTGAQNEAMGMGAMPATYAYLAKRGLISRARRDHMPVLTSSPVVPDAALVESVRVRAVPLWRKIHPR